MSATKTSQTTLEASDGLAGASRPAVSSYAPAVLWTFSVTLFVSALLLFSVQPLFARMALPKLGGAPAVWAVSMCFFQIMLLAGYCYAYALIRWFDARATVFIHAALLLVTLSTLPFGLPQGLGDPPAGDAYLWLLGVLTVGVGLPFFAVAANAPLLQAWFARTGHPDARDPYFLYGASNAGSLVALLAYPVVVEPLIGLGRQTQIWAGGFAALALLLTGCAGFMFIRMAPVAGAIAVSDDAAAATAEREPTFSDRALWVSMALIPSALMVAVTTYITTDLASAPLFWVIPLALFLVTFIVVFRETPLLPVEIAARALPLLFVAMLSLPFPGVRLVIALGAFLAAALVCHRQLYSLRPAPRFLTEFYLWMSFGGALGGLFSALIAPQLFRSAFEFTLLMIAALFCRADVFSAMRNHLDLRRVAGFGCLLAAALIGHVIAQDLGGEMGGRAMMAAILAGWIAFLYFNRSHPALQAGIMLGIGMFAWMLPASQPTIHIARSFFGVVRVIDTADGTKRLMQHGTTLHGSRRLRTANGGVVAEPIPATYYHAAGPLARGVTLARKITTGVADGAIRMGVVGLGTGSLACTTRPGDDLTYFEIDPIVAEIARNPRYFDFLSHCRPETPIVMGDARLTLAHTPAHSYDYLVIDAFSSDAVPVHLLTREALELYISKLAPHGLLALHVSNRYLDLASSVIATAKTLPSTSSVLVKFPGVEGDSDAQPSIVVLIAKDPAVLEAANGWPDAAKPTATNVAPWTDDYADVLSAIVRQLTR